MNWIKIKEEENKFIKEFDGLSGDELENELMNYVDNMIGDIHVLASTIVERSLRDLDRNSAIRNVYQGLIPFEASYEELNGLFEESSDEE